MKKILLAVIAVMMVGFAGFSKASSDIAMAPIIEKSLVYIKMLEDEKDQEVVHVEYDIIRTTKDVYRSLQKGYTYGIVAYGDDRVKAMSLKVYRKNGSKWQLVDSDTAGDEIAVVEVKPTTSGEYKFVVGVDSYNGSYRAAHYGVILFHEAP